MKSRLFSVGLRGIVHVVTAAVAVLCGDAAWAQSCISISTIDQLQSIGNSPSMPLSGSYCLVNDIDASVTGTWNGGTGFVPIGTSSNKFTGVFDGQGHFIDGLTINSAMTFIGLFGYVGPSGIVKNVGLTNESLTASGAGANVGGLAGDSEGTLVLVSSSGTIRGVGDDTTIGGLVGLNWNSITQSFSTATVITNGRSDASNGFAGGLVALNAESISQSFAAGPDHQCSVHEWC